MNAPALLAVPVEIRALDVGLKVDRVFRLAHAITPEALRLERPLPFAAGRPVEARLTLPDDDRPVTIIGVVKETAPGPHREERVTAGEKFNRLVAFTDMNAETRQRILRYVEERTAVT
ncbi:MAG: PilZ domain-containing protein [Deltaproteobacteria bacterium]|nr:PilZ domain-containing protein [Deltaproteobacteria bacterium]